jgi:flagella basal body P-ring formation protein FlgA
MVQRIWQFGFGRLWPLAALWILAGAPATMGEGKLQIYLLPEPTVESETVTLEQIGILRGDESLASKARAVTMGRFSVTGQQIVLDRATVLSRLASSGIAAESVDLRGPEKASVRRNEQHLGAERVEAVATALLKALSPAPSKIALVRPARAFSIEAGHVVEMKPRLNGPIQNGLARVCVEVVENGKVIAQQDLLFGVKYQRRRAVAAEDLAAGVQLSNANVKIESGESNDPEPKGWVAPYGMLTRQRVTKGSELEPQRLEAVEEPVLVKRRQMVVVKMETDLLLVSWLGEAQADGKAGEMIPVRMGTEKDARIIKARVRADGTLEPFKEGIRL